MEPLADPCGDRVMKEIPAPPHQPIAEDMLYPNKCIYLQNILNMMYLV